MRLGSDLGLKAIPALIKANAKIGIVVLTGYGSIATAVQAVKLGAKAYLIKPSKVETILRAMRGLTSTDSDESLLRQNASLSDERELKMPSLADVERNYIDYVLEQHQGNKSRAAEILGIPRQSLQRKLKKFTFFRRKP
jgi:two-component system response regulator RegA